jgi:hypothetical protein
VATAAADDDPAGFQRAVVAVTTSATARTIGGKDLVVGDGAAGGAALLSVGDLGAGPVGGKWTRNRRSGRLAAADDGLVAVVGLLEDRGVDAAADRGSDPCAQIVDDLSADRAGRQQASHDRANVIEPCLDRPEIIAAIEWLASIIADVLGDHDLAVASANDTLPARQLDQDG